jgi:4-aminobutyrate aminotransferase-like enzyme
MNEELIERRRRLLGPNFSTFYKNPVHIVRGKGVWLWDASGKKYLDCYNNVPHVGHCHPEVVNAIAEQAKILNTHTRYLHEGILDYLDRLLSKHHKTIETAIMVCSGSEANDIALRMAEAKTGHRGVIVTDSTYHGNTSAVSQLGYGRNTGPVGDHIRYIQAPDNFRDNETMGISEAKFFKQNVVEAIDSLKEAGHGVSALLICPFFANEGFPNLEHGFLDEAISNIRNEGAIVIADEVQPGFGRIGTNWWGYQKIGIEPEIVTMGKPMANGHPVACVATSTEIMGSFRNNYGYFNTFGGNPVSCAAASATLEVVENEKLIKNALAVGQYALKGLEELKKEFPQIKQVRGSGLFFGAEMRGDNNEPLTQYASQIAEKMRDKRILLGVLGKNRNTLKIRPPMVFSKNNADHLLEHLRDTMKEAECGL